MATITAPTSGTVAVTWPTRTCTRCSGTGRHSYCQRYGDTCFRCSGAGVEDANATVTSARARLAETARGQKRCTANQLAPGQIVRVTDGRLVAAVRRGDGGRWLEVYDATIDLGRPTGWSTTNGIRTATSWHTTVTLVDGTVLTSSGNMLVRTRSAGVDPTPYLQAALDSLRGAAHTAYIDALRAAGWDVS